MTKLEKENQMLKAALQEIHDIAGLKDDDQSRFLEDHKWNIRGIPDNVAFYPYAIGAIEAVAERALDGKYEFPRRWPDPDRKEGRADGRQ